MRIIFKFILLYTLILLFALSIGCGCVIFSLIMWDKQYIETADELVSHLMISFFS